MAELPVFQDAIFLDRVRVFEEYLDHSVSTATNLSQTNYKDAILRMLQTQSRRLVVNLDEIRDFNRDLASG